MDHFEKFTKTLQGRLLLRADADDIIGVICANLNRMLVRFKWRLGKIGIII